MMIPFKPVKVRTVSFIRTVIVNLEFKRKPFPKRTLIFTCLQYKSFENTEGKGEIARNEQFFLFPQCFLPVWRTFCHFNKL